MHCLREYAGEIFDRAHIASKRCSVQIARWWWRRHELHAGALRLPGVMQSLTHMAPATALLFTIQFTTSQAGIVAPLAYLVAFPIVMVLGVCLIQLAKHFPSAGGYYTYVSRTVHPPVGFLASWLYFLYDPVVAGFLLAFIGSVLEQALKAA